jgi:LPXTG-site transpeptidase (sortase) family protein
VAARRRVRLLVGAICLLTLGVGAYFAAIKYLAWRESESPSAGRVLVLKDGRRIPLRQPGYGEAAVEPTGGLIFSPAAPQGSEEAGGTAAAPGTPGVAEFPERGAPGAWPAVPKRQVMPPVRLVMSDTRTRWPVVLSNGIQLPRFKAIGWLLGSAYPGAPGNMVLFGHVDGKYATLDRLKDVAPGDTFSVLTSDAEYRYRVRSVFETTPDDVGVMAPTGAATATLITCSGRWDAADGMYDRRLVVTADYLPV